MTGTIRIEALKTRCIIGIHPWERRHRQTVLITVEFGYDTEQAVLDDAIEAAIDYRQVITVMETTAQEGHFRLLERLTASIAEALMDRFPIIQQISVTAEKPRVSHGYKAVAVSVTTSISANGGAR